MSQGLFAAVSGVRANQTRMNVISNNIANVNTVGFKSSNSNFATVFSSTISGGNAPTGTIGGTNPKQIGNGALVAEIQSNFSQGGTQFTGRSTDLMIQGEGFFAVERVDSNLGTVSASYYLTRAGNFSLDSAGNLVTSNGNRVRGTSQLSGSSPATLTTINIPQQMTIVKDLDANNNVIATHFAVPVNAANQAALTAAITAANTGVTQNIAQVKLVNFTVGAEGSITATYSNGDRITVRTDINTVSADATTARREVIHLPSEGGTFAADNDGDPLNQQASDAGIVSQIAGFEMLLDGTGAASMEGMQLQIQTATVVNAGGLLYDGSNNFLTGPNSGETSFGTPASENRGGLQGGALESSNVDLAGEFTNLIVTQRGLEASSKVIRSQSEVLQTIINII